ncbi:glycosyltransferase family 25 protein [Actinobacillus pleuropneumoniae]|uniref:Lipooligosaccharide biosynthesis protein n=2 Tax=Actinobacillus pleuropneumoniae TaxID=715 RepID=A0A828PUJ3_ACTPL|nr:Lipooligosaccharide biosynthesis protein [Actinobacillus pleuropneumoniae serovar 6 str. Femo]EFN00532.1 Lipooligosaccharide biosynthesis protein [Actinobacillus pleuropneumoniae serovar 12 str. 1096]EFN02648.1 Lipooligosaccharide biosynthesis protein [Actinobacillus pleuropneumoniae serovar 13 str. N273]UKH18653.1 glycosyltransferase family 25 protein [Actinobacillus pleuropneumoniae]UKH28855.1 glycosyltransferase family 25 protein [Actinobacillus pleuropneumoniae]
MLQPYYLPKDMDILKLEQHFYRADMSIFPRLTYLGRKFYKLKSKHVGAAGYIVSRKGIDYILEQLNTYHLSIPIDDLIFEALLKNEDYLVLQMNPAVCIQDFILNKDTNFKSALKGERDIRCTKKIGKQKLTPLKKLIKELKRPFLQLKRKKIYFK